MSHTIVIFNDRTEYPFSNEVLRQIPYFNDNTADKIHVVTAMDIQFRHLSIISKILSNSRILPMIDATSHFDVLTVLNLASFLGISGDTISTGFNGWTDHRKWIDLWQPEYLYLIYSINEDLVDFKKFFRLHKNIMESVTKAVKLPELRARPELYMEMLMFFKNFDFATCFDSNDDKIHAKIESLGKDRSAAWETFLVNPHDDFIAPYFGFTPTICDVWDCKGISAIEAPVAGERTIASFKISKERFFDFTHGLIDKSVNPAMTRPFPHANVVFAGGAVAKILARDYSPNNARQSDADIFIIGKTFEERSKIFEEVLAWFKTCVKGAVVSRTYYAIRGSVISIYIKDISRKFQIISSNHSNPFDVISRFDLSHIQWCIWNNQFYGTPESCRAMREKITRFGNTHRLRTSRLIKALHCGYSIQKNADVIEKFVDITELVDDPTSMQMQQIIMDLYGWYYPRTDDSMSPEDMRMHILCQINKDSNATMVTDDPAFVTNNVTIGGNFESDYESILFKTFNPAVIQNKALPRHITRVSMRSKHGIIRLTTCTLQLVKIISTDMGLEIVAKVNEQPFVEFCHTLEGVVYRMFRAGGVTRHILDDKSEMKFIVPKYKIERQNTRGISCLRNQRGLALNIEEDLRPGDEFQVLFSMDILMFPEDRAVELKPLKFVKYQKFDPDAVEQTVNDDLEKELAQMIADDDFDGTIQYDDPISEISIKSTSKKM